VLVRGETAGDSSSPKTLTINCPQGYEAAWGDAKMTILFDPGYDPLRPLTTVSVTANDFLVDSQGQIRGWEASAEEILVFAPRTPADFLGTWKITGRVTCVG
jgi:hypothetical protein